MFPFYYGGAQHYECMAHEGTPSCNVNKEWGSCAQECTGNFVVTVILIMTNCTSGCPGNLMLIMENISITLVVGSVIQDNDLCL